MKRFFTAILLTFTALLCVSCSLFATYAFNEVLPKITDPATWEPNVISATVENADGEKMSLEIVDLENLYLNLSGPECERKKQNANDAYLYKITLTLKDSKTDHFYIYSDIEFYYDGYMYESLVGKAELSMLDNMFKAE